MGILDNLLKFNFGQNALLPGGAGQQGENLGMPTNGGSGGDSAQSRFQAIVQILKQFNPQMDNMLINSKNVQFPGVQHKQLPMGEMSTGGTKKDSVHNLYTSIGNAIKTIGNIESEKKAKKMEFNLSRIQTALNNPTPENKALVDEMLADPKTRKDIEKAIGTKFFDEKPDKDANSPERKGADAFRKKQEQSQAQAQGPLGVGSGGLSTTGAAPPISAGAGRTPGNMRMDIPTTIPTNGQGGQTQPQHRGFADQILSKFPTTQQINPQVMLQAELIKAGIVPKTSEQMTMLTDLMKDDTKMQIAFMKAAQAGDIAKMRLFETMMRIKQQGSHDKSQERIGGGHDASRVKSAEIMAGAQKDRNKLLIGAKGDSEKYHTAAEINKELGTNSKEIEAKQKALKDAVKVAGSAGGFVDFVSGGKDKKAAQDNVTKLQDEIKKLEDRNGLLRHALDNFTNVQEGAQDTTGESNDGSNNSDDFDSFYKGLEDILKDDEPN